MGINACFAIEFKEPPTEDIIKKLRFNLLVRFREILEWRNGSKELLPVLIKKDKKYAELHNIGFKEDCLYEIDSLVRYYSEGYARGPGLEISNMLIYLNSLSEIETVFYGGDSLYPIKNKAIDLYMYWLDNADLEYTLRKNPYNKEEPPLCDYCNMPMREGGFDGKKRIYGCVGCWSTK